MTNSNKIIRFHIVLLVLFFSIFARQNLHAQETANLITAVEEVAQNIGPAVVSIKTERVQRYRQRRSYYGSPFEDKLFNQFFAEFFGEPLEYEQRSGGFGSGVIVDDNGYILTNEHVVRGADKITVVLPDGRQFQGSLEGTDSRSDLAVVKINASDLPVAKLGDSEDLKIGQWVVAIGNPFGHILDDPAPTVTSGVVSALHRSLPGTSRRDTDYSDLIQTDAAINPGNSGGPLVNLKGDVVGINVAIFSTSGGYQGIGFAIPVNYAKQIVDALIKGNGITYGWIGVYIQNLNPGLSRYFNLPHTDGVLLDKIVPQGPAEKAGLKEGDIILKVNNVKMRSSLNLIRYIGNTEVGKKVQVQIIRDGKEKNIPLVIEARPVDDEVLNRKQPSPRRSEVPAKSAFRWRGLTVRGLSGETARHLGLSDANGIIIKEVEPNSRAMAAGFRRGDVIIAINKMPVKTMADYNRAVSQARGACLIRTIRGFFVIEE